MGLAKQLLDSAFFSAGSKLLTRFLGLISTLIVARILTPSDFANVAVVSILLYLFDTLSHAGSEQYVMQKTRLLRRELASAWSFNLLIKLFMSLTLVGLAPILLTWFNKPELTQGLQAAALVLSLNACAHPAIMQCKRALDYRPIFILTLAHKVAAFIVLIVLAWYLKSFWAFIIADLVAASIYCGLSYLIFTGKVRFTLKYCKPQWDFSKWMIGKALLGYLRSQIDTLVVSYYFSKNILGHYYVARDLAMLPAHTLLGPALEPLISAFKDQQLKPSEQISVQVNLIFTVILAVLTPTCLFMFYFAELSVLALFGEQWQLAANLLKPLSFLLFYWVILLIAENLLISIGKIKAIFIADMFALVFIALTLISYALSAPEIMQLAWLRVGLGVLSTFILIVYLYQKIRFSFFNLFVSATSYALISYLCLVLVRPLANLSELHFMNFLMTGCTFLILYLLFIVSVLFLFRRHRYFQPIWHLILVKLPV
ncbi:oligosaccharide flippase family protein [Gayadomonas joobiniege]|uniref:oligosaccharide flippase family protein n=1 Tax=Gayadomonas joobiniege TaxID=1234606 RepID=UPI00037FB44D|nr:oligosaccharide flippase family protein [Gayadomonas joobiniege]